jgi:hypothetical protein
MYSSSTPASSTPGRLPCRVITGGERPSAYAQFVLDPTAGNGAPMARWPRERRFAWRSTPTRWRQGDCAARSPTSPPPHQRSRPA